MKGKLLSMLAVSLLGASGLAQAIPISYDMTFQADTGPNGIGSFIYDAEAARLSNFNWNFADGAYVGRLTYDYENLDILGGPIAAFVFELLSGLDIHPANCTSACGMTPGYITGAGALGAANVTFVRDITSSSARYYFFNRLPSDPPRWIPRDPLAFGLLSIKASSVPEPATLGLLSLGLVGVVIRRRRSV